MYVYAIIRFSELRLDRLTLRLQNYLQELIFADENYGSKLINTIFYACTTTIQVHTHPIV